LKNNLDRLKRDVISHGMIEGLFLTGQSMAAAVSIII
jgi:hypothetical protein